LVRLVYTSDLHGCLEFYRAAGEAAQRHRADAIVLGGDLCPGTPSASAIHLPRTQPEFLLREIGPMIEAWKRAQPDLQVLVIPGNDDCQTILPALEVLEQRGLLKNLHRKAARLGDYTFAGLSFVPPTPFAIKDFERWDSAASALREPPPTPCVLGTPEGFRVIEDFEAYLNSQPSIEEELERLPTSDSARTVAVIHCPPHQTRCDVLYDGRHIGSQALRHWIERHQPLLTLHGHIHESPRLSGGFFDTIGETVVVNPGCDHSRPHLVLMDLENLSEMEHSVYGRQGRR
jgi:Icc-related predicted phosphoesterase